MKQQIKLKQRKEKSKENKSFLSSTEWILFGLTFLIYANTIFFDYALDDSMVITNNVFTKEGFSGLYKIFTNDSFLGFSQEILGNTDTKNLVQGGRYRPLSIATFAIEYNLFGKVPLISHLINIIIYAIIVVLLYRLLKLLFNEQNEGSGLIKNISFCISLLFVTHPIHTEVIANIKGRDELLALLFSLASWYSIFKNKELPKYKNVVFACSLFFLALLSKESAIAFLIIIPLSVFVFDNSCFKLKTNQFLGLLFVAVFFIIVRQSIVLPASDSTIGGLMNNPFLNVSFTNRVATAFYTFTKYYQLLIFPHPLTYDYYPNHISIQQFSSIGTLIGIFLTFLFLFVSVFLFRKNKVVSFSILFFYITFFLVSNIPINIGAFMAERFIFVPSIGFCIFFGYYIYTYKNKQWAKNIFFIAIFLFATKSFSRNFAWKNNKILFETDVQTSYNSAHVNKNIGETYLTEASKQTSEIEKQQLYKKSAFYLKKAVGIYYDYYDAWVSLGNNYYFNSQFDDAIICYYISIKLNSEKSIRLYRAIADIYGLNLGNYQKSIVFMLKALAFEKKPLELLTNISIAYYRSKNYEQAIVYTKKVLQIEPQNAQAKTNLNVFESEFKNTQNK